ncbi:MAG: flagellar basal body-associated FliL family protein [Desulfobacteraceae bacterium]|jgi:flagellar basal body-associated protein FliL
MAKKEKKEEKGPVASEGEPLKKRLLKNKKLLLIVGIALILCIVGGAAGYMFFAKSQHSADETVKDDATNQGESKVEGEHGAKTDDKGHGEQPAGEEKGAHGEAAEGQGAEKEEPNVFDHIYIMPSIEIKLGEPGHEKTFKVDIKLEMDRPELAVEFNDRKEMIQGALRSILASKTQPELESAEAKIRLKMALIAELNRRLETGKVRNIYFTDFLIM